MNYNQIALIYVDGNVRIGVINAVSKIEDAQGKRTVATVEVSNERGVTTDHIVREEDLCPWKDYNTSERDTFVRESADAKRAFERRDRNAAYAAAPTPVPAAAAVPDLKPGESDF